MSLAVAGTIFIFSCGVWLYRTNYPSYMVQGSSMAPSYLANQSVQVISHQRPQRFDVVAIDMGAEGFYLKRIIGLPGEKLAYSKQQLYVDGQKIADPFANQTADFQLEQLFQVERIPVGQYFVLGDNRAISKDSRSIGFIKAEKIIGIIQKGTP